MKTTISIHKAPNNDPLYEVEAETVSSVGFMLQTAPDSVHHFWDGNMSVVFCSDRPVYVYNDGTMIYVSNLPLSCCGPLLAFWVPEKAVAA